MECGVLVCGKVAILQNVESQWWCGIVICNVLCDCSVMSYVENDAMCCDVRCGGVIRYGIWCGVMRCGIWWCEICCDVECGCGVANSCGYGMATRVRCGLCDVERHVLQSRCGGVKWWYRGRLQCNVISDVEYGGPR